MSDSGDIPRYKWTPESTALLVSVWSDRQVQKQLEYASKPQVIWENVARYLRKKGYNVSAKQCRSRMKQLLVCYREAKRAGTRAGVEQYYESIDMVLKNKRMEQLNGVDTVDATMNVKSPPKEMKTNKNLQMRHKCQEPVQSLYRTEALSPTWASGRENEYPDSPESNETIIARPCSIFSPKRDVAINTMEQVVEPNRKNIQRNCVVMEEPIREEYRQNLLMNYPYGEIPFQNTVQNVQNQIIQENMQQHHHQNYQQSQMWHQMPQQNLLSTNLAFQQNLQNMNQGMKPQQVFIPAHANIRSAQNSNTENILRQQNQLQQTAMINNQAMPQEPRKIVFGQNLAATYKKETLPRPSCVADTRRSGYLSPDYSPDVSQNLNDAFCQLTKTEEKTHNLNETFNQSVQLEGVLNSDMTVLTNNATCNDDSLLLEFLMESPTPSESESKSKVTAVNTENMPNAPFRKKKAQKLEQLVLNAINSQNEVVNKILAAQNDMVSRFLDVDRDRQNRLENRLDHLLNVVHTSVLNKAPEVETDEQSSSPEPVISSLIPPPKPGTIPPKLDLVPPKPCRVPCTVANSNIELINQNPIQTRPGVVSPINSPGKKPGTIWSKLGPVSQSPFVKAQQRLGLQPVRSTNVRTQSSAERRIAKENGTIRMDTENMIFETTKFLEAEKQLEEMIENARIEMNMGQTLSARRRLFTRREPTPEMILTAAFLEEECRLSQFDPKVQRFNVSNSNKQNNKDDSEDDLLAGQGDSYNRLRQLNVQSNYLSGEPCDSSTPAKLVNTAEETYRTTSKQTIQQLARLVMNSARWKDIALKNRQFDQLSGPTQPKNPEAPTGVLKTNIAPHQSLADVQKQESLNRALNWIQNKQSISNLRDEQKQYAPSYNEPVLQKPKFSMGFTTTMLENKPNVKEVVPNYSKSIGFNDNVLPDRKQNVRFMDEALAELQRMYLERNAEGQREKFENTQFIANNGNTILSQNRQLIEQYLQDAVPKKQIKESKDTDSDNDEEYLDTTMSMPPSTISRRGSLTSTGTTSTETKQYKLDVRNCAIS